MVHRRFVVSLVVAAWTSLGACSGAETQDVLSGPSATASSSGTSGATSDGTSGTTSGGASGTPPPGPTTKPPESCAPEDEPNDSKATANLIAPARCGTLSPRDQKDFLTFQLQPSTKSMSVQFTGRVRLKVDVAGKNTVELTPDKSGVVPFVMGEKYSIEITALTNAGGEIPWRVVVVEN